MYAIRSYYEDVKNSEGDIKLGKAVQIALNQVVGAYAIAVFDKTKPNEIIVAKLGSPFRITSYNVCYTKLLRPLFHDQLPP